MSGKRPTDHLEPAAKKRGSERQLTKDDDLSDGEEIEPGIFSRASEQVLKQRKIVRARRPGAAAVAGGPTAPASANPFANVQLAPGGAAATPSANPFAGISLVKPPSPAAEPEAKQQAASTAAPAPVTADKEGEPESKDATADKESEPVKAAEDAEPPAADKPAAGGFGALSSTAPGLSFGSSGGFGALSSSAGGFGGFASAASGAAFGAPANGSSGAAFSFLAAPPASEGGASAPSVFGTATATGTALFGGDAPKHATAELPAEVPVSTGEEAEQSVFTGDGILFEFDAGKQWRERGRGQIKVNVDPAKGQGRLVMRQKGNLRLLLNANLWPEMQVTRMDGGVGVTFACLNHLESGGEAGVEDDKAAGQGQGSLKMATYALRIKPQEVLEQFVAAVEGHKGGKSE